MKMFGKKSLSTLLFWVVVLCILFLSVIFIRFFPDLIKNKNVPFLLNVIPLVGYFGLLIPLALILNTFRKKVLFTKQSVKYLRLFALLNFLIPAFNVLTMTLIYSFELKSMIYSLPLNILLAVFALFIASIFKQGFKVQQENDLTI